MFRFSFDRVIYPFCLLLVALILGPINAQRMDRITHLKGTRTINGVQVTVTQEGYVDSLSYCGDDTGPYFAGNDYSKTCCKTGSYIFTFSQPIKEVFLNIAALSTNSSFDEEAQIFVNGEHYFVKDLGENSGCEPMPVISDQGNIRPCESCSGSGADKIRITGPINSIKVTCQINKGEPQGMVFGFYMGDKIKNTNSSTSTVMQNDAGMGLELIIQGDDLKQAFIALKDSNETSMTIHYRTIQDKKIIIDVSELPVGPYLLEIKQGVGLEKQKILIQ